MDYRRECRLRRAGRGGEIYEEVDEKEHRPEGGDKGYVRLIFAGGETVPAGSGERDADYPEKGRGGASTIEGKISKSEKTRERRRLSSASSRKTQGKERDARIPNLRGTGGETYIRDDPNFRRNKKCSLLLGG